MTFFIDADQESERINLTDNEWQEVKNFFLEETPKAVDYFPKYH